MLVINENDRRLLNMKEKLLEITQNDNESVLEDYEKLAKDIDNDCYNQIVNKINKTDYNSLSLEEQIVFLSEIEEDYNYLNEFQWIVRNTYSKYNDNDIELSDINNILIDNIIERISDIHGYLMNIKNLDSNEMEVDRLNRKLISLENEKVQIKKLINDIRSKLKNDIVGAEGRVYDFQGNIIPISINSELKKYDVSLNEMLNDSLKLTNVYKTFSEDEKALEEKFKATIDLPKRNEEICHQIENDMIVGKYKLALVELINEVTLDDDEYTSFKERLYKIDEIIDNLKTYSSKLGVRFYINPFDRIKIDSQIQVINAVKNVDKEIDNIKKTITYITSMIDEAADKNRELITLINGDLKIVKDDDNDLVVEEATTEVKTFSDIAKNNNVSDKQVIKIAEPKVKFKIERAHEKSDGVIKRVFEMISMVPVVTEKVETPQLVLEPVGKEKIENDNPVLEDMTSQFDDNGENVFIDDSNDSVVYPEITNDVSKTEEDAINNNHINVSDVVSDNSNNIFIDLPPQGEDTEMFQEVPPFEDTPLFSDRYDSEIFESEPKMMLDLSADDTTKENVQNKNNIIQFSDIKKDDVAEPAMPEAFWVTKDDEVKDDKDNVLSIDEQVASLISNDDQIKVMKKVV